MKIGYVPYSSQLNQPGDRRRFVAYAKSRHLDFEVADFDKEYDVVILSEKADISVWSKYKKGKLVFDFIDSYLAVPKTDIKGLLRGFAKFVLRQNRYLQLNYWRALRRMCIASDAVICTTMQQKDDIKQSCDNVHIILDVHTMLLPGEGCKSNYASKNKFKIVWEGLPHTLDSLRVIAPVLKRMESEYLIEFHIITDLEYHNFLGVFGKVKTSEKIRKIFPNAILHEWQERSIFQNITSCDLAVIPIDLRDKFASGKPENKLTLFWKMGMPVVVSASPAYVSTMRAAGINGFDCSDEAQWQKAIAECIESVELRKKIASLGYSYSLSEYSEESIFRKWDQLFESLVTSSRIPILVLINNFSSGGTEGQILNVFKSIDSSKFDVSIFVLSSGGRLAEQFFSSDLKIYQPNDGESFFSLLKRLAAVIKEKRPIVHCFLPRPYLIGGYLALMFKSKALIMSRRSRNFYQKRHNIAKYFEYFLHKKADLLLANSKIVADDLLKEGAPNNAVRILYNGVDLSKYQDCRDDSGDNNQLRCSLGIGENKIVITCVANLFSYKGHEDLLDAVFQLGNIFIEKCCLLIIGRDENHLATLKTRVDVLNLNKNVIFLGERMDIPEILQISDIGILVSHQEGFSNAVLEYMASGLPVIVTDVGGNSEVVSDNKMGFVIPVGDIAEISNALEKLILNTPLRKSFGSEARKKIQSDYSLSRCVASYEEIYRKLMLPPPNLKDNYKCVE